MGIAINYIVCCREVREPTLSRGASSMIDRGRKSLQVLQTSSEAEYKLDDNNCLADFSGR